MTEPVTSPPSSLSISQDFVKQLEIKKGDSKETQAVKLNMQGSAIEQTSSNAVAYGNALASNVRSVEMPQ